MSLLVGGIGILNIMLVSAAERTREIGIHLAIGAIEREVLLRFLVEGVGLSGLGGLSGIALATGASIGLASLMGVPYPFGAVSTCCPSSSPQAPRETPTGGDCGPRDRAVGFRSS